MSGKDENKVYYWMALKNDFFDRPAMVQLLNQENAWEYIGLYIQLCLQTINSQGYLVSKIGKKFFPFTEKLIARETGYHTEEFVVKALELFADLELVKIGYKGYKYIPEVQESIGSSSNGKSAKYKDKERTRKKIEESFDDFFEIAVSDNKISTDAVDKTSTDAVDKTSTDAVDKTSTDAVDKTSTDAVDKTSTDAVDKTSTDIVDKTSTDAVDKTSTDAVDKTSTDIVDKISTDAVDKISTVAVDKISTVAVDKISTVAVDKISTVAVDKISTDIVDKISTDIVDKISTVAVDKISTDDWTKCPSQYTDYSIQITDNRNTIIDDVDLKNDQNLIHLSVERDAEESLKNCKSKNAKELLNALASPKTNWDTIIPVEYIRECEAYTTPETADKEYMLLKKVKNSFNKRDSKTISLATSEQVYSILDAVKAVVTGEMETPVMNQSGYIANCFRNTFRL